MTVFIHPLAKQDYNEALFYYEDESPSLAMRFEVAFSNGMQRISATPTAFPFHLKQKVYRRYKVDRFPYLILYRVRDDVISVAAVKHEKQRPSFGLNRL